MRINYQPPIIISNGGSGLALAVAGYVVLTVRGFVGAAACAHSGGCHPQGFRTVIASIDPARLEIKNYEGGHMMYLYQPSLEKLADDIVAFIGQD